MNASVRGFQDLLAWQKGMDFAVEAHRLSLLLPKHEMFALSAQLRRAAVSVPSNIAEGQGRGAGPDFCRFLRVALGSLQEAQTQLLLAERVGYFEEGDLEKVLSLCEDVQKLCRKLLASIPRTVSRSPTKQ